MEKNSPQVFFLGNGRCYHTLDWYRSAQEVSSTPPELITDLIESESFEKLILSTDIVHQLFILDPYLCKNQSLVGNIWRNLLKLLAIPTQVLRLRRILKNYDGAVIHAHSMYYIALARFSRTPYVATPQGSEILVRPYRSLLYRLFSKVALSKAHTISVDSDAMRCSLKNLFGLESTIIQNGINLQEISKTGSQSTNRSKITSIRALTPNYRISQILEHRNKYSPETVIHFCSPFVQEDYVNKLKKLIFENDVILGRLKRKDLYQLLSTSIIAISIPASDSSPRSVYEAIFCGCYVVTMYDKWMDTIPSCMQSRIILVDLESKNWLSHAIEYARVNATSKYTPSREALELFDQKVSMLKFFEEIYPKAISARRPDCSEATLSQK